jgi:hypothetical protein
MPKTEAGTKRPFAFFARYSKKIRWKTERFFKASPEALIDRTQEISLNLERIYIGDSRTQNSHSESKQNVVKRETD